jgi:hypothetical protein
MAAGAVIAHIRPLMAQDAKIDLKPAFAGVTAKNFKAKIPDMAAGIVKATRGKMAVDAEVSDLVELLDALSGEAPLAGLEGDAEGDLDEGVGAPPVEGEGAPAAEGEGAPPVEGAAPAEGEQAPPDPMAAIKEFLVGKLSEEDMAALTQLIAQAAPAGDEEVDPAVEKRDTAQPESGVGATDETEEDKDKPMDKPALDAAIKAAEARATTNALKIAREIRDAEKAVKPYVGELAIACDSADGVYKAALKALGVKIDGVHPSAYRAILEAQPVPGSNPQPARVALDAAAAKSFSERFPSLERIGHL